MSPPERFVHAFGRKARGAAAAATNFAVLDIAVPARVALRAFRKTYFEGKHQREKKSDRDVVTLERGKAAGSETFNRVDKYGYATPIGDSGTTTGYFKPEPTNADGLPDGAFGIGIGSNAGEHPHMAARAVASSLLDRALGLRLLAAEVLATHTGPDGNDEHGSVSADVGGRPLTYNKDKAGAEIEHNSIDYRNPTTQKGLADLQLLDWLSSQVDRHGGNIHVLPNGEVRGIDNDIAFGTDDDPTGVQHNLGLPPLVARETANEVLAMTPEDIEKLLTKDWPAGRSFTEGEIEAAKRRLAKLQDHVRSLEGKDVANDAMGIVEPGAWNETTFQAARRMDWSDFRKNYVPRTYVGRHVYRIQRILLGKADKLERVELAADRADLYGDVTAASKWKKNARRPSRERKELAGGAHRHNASAQEASNAPLDAREASDRAAREERAEEEAREESESAEREAPGDDAHDAPLGGDGAGGTEEEGEQHGDGEQHAGGEPVNAAQAPTNPSGDAAHEAPAERGLAAGANDMDAGEGHDPNQEAGRHEHGEGRGGKRTLARAGKRMIDAFGRLKEGAKEGVETFAEGRLARSVRHDFRKFKDLFYRMVGRPKRERLHDNHVLRHDHGRPAGEQTLNRVDVVHYVVSIGDSGATKGYFKPEITDTNQVPTEAYLIGIGRRANKGGSLRLAARAVMSSLLDRALGTKILSAEVFATHTGPDGELESGSTSADVGGKKLTNNDKSLGVEIEHNSIDYRNPTTQRGLSDLQVLDWLSSQVDRHGGNIHVLPNGEVRGIDNDQAFGTNADPTGIAKNIGMPPLVSYQMAEKIMAMTPDDMERLMTEGFDDENSFSEQEIAAAKERLTKLQEHIQSLQSKSIAKDGMGIVYVWNDTTFDAAKRGRWGTSERGDSEFVPSTYLGRHVYRIQRVLLGNKAPHEEVEDASHQASDYGDLEDASRPIDGPPPEDPNRNEGRGRAPTPDETSNAGGDSQDGSSNGDAGAKRGETIQGDEPGRGRAATWAGSSEQSGDSSDGGKSGRGSPTGGPRARLSTPDAKTLSGDAGKAKTSDGSTGSHAKDNFSIRSSLHHSWRFRARQRTRTH